MYVYILLNYVILFIKTKLKMVIKSVYISLNQCVWLLAHTTYAHIGVNNIISCYDDTFQATQQTSVKAKFE